MNEHDFWAFLERKKSPDKAKYLAQLGLSKLPSVDLKDFEAHYRSKVAELDRDDVRAAATLINRGRCSDDYFLYFRYWLVSLGETAFNEVAADPDALSKHVGPEAATEAYQFEEMLYAIADAGRQNELKNEYNREMAKAKLPRLWAMFGTAKARSGA